MDDILPVNAIDRQKAYEDSLANEIMIKSWFEALGPSGVKDFINQVWINLRERDHQTIAKGRFRQLWDKHSHADGEVISFNSFLELIRDASKCL